MIFQCRPIRGFWTREAGTVCLGVKEGLYGVGVVNIVTDFALLVIPLPSIWKLKLSVPKKLGLSIVFLLGLFVSGVSILRMFIVYQSETLSPDVTCKYYPSSALC